jgi:hypothetical protein
VPHGPQLGGGQRCRGALRVQTGGQVVAAPPQRVALGGCGGGGIAGGAFPGGSGRGGLPVPIRLRRCSRGCRQLCLQILHTWEADHIGYLISAINTVATLSGPKAAAIRCYWRRTV